jgi:hypothetical protein
MSSPFVRLAARRALSAVLLPALGVTSLLIVPAHAMPIARVSWDDCDPVVTNKSWSGPGTYVQVVSAVGLAPGLQAVGLGFVMGGLTDAWWFSDDQFDHGCHPPADLAMSSTGTGCAAAPVTQFTFEPYLGLTNPFVGGYSVFVYFDANFAPDPAVRYTLVRLAFDHSNSVAGPSTPGHCGSADVPKCFALVGSYYSGLPNPTGLVFDSDYLTWQDFNDSHGERPCPLAVPARATTWGQIKGMYR